MKPHLTIKPKKKFMMFKKAIVIIIASLFYAIGVSLFLDPNDLAPGGITGISILLNRLIPVEVGTLILLLNIPLLLIAWKKFGIRFVISTFEVLILIALISNLLKNMKPITTDPLLAAVGGGATMSIGLGMILKTGATTGGTDIVVKLLRLKYRHLKTGFLFFAIDVFIISLSVFVFHNVSQAMYAGISLLIMSKVLDWVLYGTDEAKLIYIISDHPNIIAEQFLGELEIGVTYLEGVGAYTNCEKKILMCVMKKRIAPTAEEIVRQTDTDAFMIITNASEIYGEGYKSYFGSIL